MAERHSTIRITRRYSARPDRVFEAWLDPRVAGQWLFATAARPMARVDIDARVDGAFCFVERQDGEAIEHTGQYIEIAPPRRLVFTLAAASSQRGATRVEVQLVPLKTGCELRLVHEHVHPDHAAHTETRWTGILYGLGVTLAANVDNRRKGPIRLGPRGIWRMSNSGPAERLQGVTNTR